MSPTQIHVSAGGVVYRRTPGGQIEVVLIATEKGERWGLPKGWIEKHEPVEEAALREVREETGLTARIVERLERVEYWFRERRGSGSNLVHKYVHFYLMEAVAGDLNDHDHEVDEARWFPLEEAIETASYKSERQMLEQARDLLAGT